MKKREFIKEAAVWMNEEAANEYVQSIESLHYSLRFLLLRYPQNIKFVSVKYEDFVHSEYGNDWWKLIEAFLGINANKMSANKSWMEREHALPCFEKIKNWKNMKKNNKLNESDSFCACQMINS